MKNQYYLGKFTYTPYLKYILHSYDFFFVITKMEFWTFFFFFRFTEPPSRPTPPPAASPAPPAAAGWPPQPLRQPQPRDPAKLRRPHHCYQRDPPTEPPQPRDPTKHRKPIRTSTPRSSQARLTFCAGARAARDQIRGALYVQIVQFRAPSIRSPDRDGGVAGRPEVSRRGSGEGWRQRTRSSRKRGDWEGRVRRQRRRPRTHAPSFSDAGGFVPLLRLLLLCLSHSPPSSLFLRRLSCSRRFQQLGPADDPPASAVDDLFTLDSRKISWMTSRRRPYNKWTLGIHAWQLATYPFQKPLILYNFFKINKIDGHPQK